jgi:hypothetical protein
MIKTPYLEVTYRRGQAIALTTTCHAVPVNAACAHAELKAVFWLITLEAGGRSALRSQLRALFRLPLSIGSCASWGFRLFAAKM